MRVELILLWSAIVAYVIAGVVAIFGVALDKRPHRTVLGAMAIGLALHAVSIGLRWSRLGHGPFLSVFEILSSNIWSLLLVYSLAYWRVRQVRGTAALVMPVLFVMMGWMMLSDPGGKAYPTTFDTVWLYIHVGLSKVFLGSVLVAVGMAGAVLGRDVFGARLAQLPDNLRLDDLAYRFMALGLVFDTLMLISGAIWAQKAWGRYWTWAPLETSSLITWLLLGLALHLRFTLKVQPRAGAAMVQLVFVVAFLTFFGTPFISQAPHKGTF